MQETIFDILEKLLKTDKRFLAEDNKTLLKNKIQELALQDDADLIALLLSNEDIKKKFFYQVDEVKIFKKDQFLKFLLLKQWLPDSYTQFTNKIGLAVDDEFMIKNQAVVLNFPYKDAVLAGGQDKEDAKREEVFYNETLAPDQINFLLAPKVFKNAVRYNATGANSGKKFGKLQRRPDGTIAENLLIKGNNLLALHSLERQFAGKVKLIYIDPPYNTGNDSFGYNDNFNHSTWLVFMKNRLEIAKRLLRDDGCIFVQCDDNEQAYLKVLMDEIFGRDNFIRNVSIKKKQSAGVGQDSFILDVVEYNLIYVKNFDNFEYKKFYIDVPFDEKQMNNYSSYYSKKFERMEYKKITDARGNLITIYKIDTEINRLSKDQQIIENYIKNFNRHFVTYNPQSTVAKKIIKEIDKDAFFEAEYKKTRGKNKDKLSSVYFYKGRIVQMLKDMARIENNKIIKFQTIDNFWSDIFWDTISYEGGVSLNNGKKPEKLLARIIDMVTNPDDIILDYHLGSGTTCAVAHKTGRQYIGIEQIDYKENSSLERLKNVVGGDQSGISKSVGWKGGGEFVYAELAQHNEIWRNKIDNAKDNECQQIWQEMKDKAFLHYRADPKEFDKNANEFYQLSLSDQKKFLYECLDKNQLYVNLSEIDDKDYKIPQADKEFTKDFYQD